MCNEKELTDIRSLNLIELTEFVTAELGEPKFRAKQLYQWMHQHLALNYDEMKNIPKSLKDKLEQNCNYHPLQQVDLQVSKIDGTRKYLFQLWDGQMVESVWMSYKHGNSVCISSQVGCKMGCRFCASTLDGWVRNLTPSEMLGQIYAIQRDTGERVSNLVVMGTGEPMDNYDNIVKFVRLLSDENGLNISQRNITVSTCGIVPRIRQLAEEDLTITLAISLHAPTNAQRLQTMPVTKKYPIEEIIKAVKYYFDKTGRRIVFEYAMIEGQNDTLESSKALVALLKGLTCHVNVIPLNYVKERGLKGTNMDSIKNFIKYLEDHKISATKRRTMGADIEGACGQLRRKYLNKDE